MPHIDQLSASFSFHDAKWLTLSRLISRGRSRLLSCMSAGAATVCLLCLQVMLPAHAASTAQNSLQPLEPVRAAAITHAEANLPALDEGRWHISANQLDQRLRLNTCVVPLETHSPKLSPGHKVIQVRCSETEPASQHGWSLYVPVHIQQYLPQIVARQSLGPGAVLDSSMLLREERAVRSGRARHYADVSGLIGARVKRTISAGSPITPNQICLICRGDSVTIVAQGSGIEVKSQGEALGDGTLGETISVRNDRSRRVVRARVVGLGQVAVNF